MLARGVSRCSPGLPLPFPLSHLPPRARRGCVGEGEGVRVKGSKGLASSSTTSVSEREGGRAGAEKARERERARARERERERERERVRKRERVCVCNAAAHFHKGTCHRVCSLTVEFGSTYTRVGNAASYSHKNQNSHIRAFVLVPQPQRNMLGLLCREL